MLKENNEILKIYKKEKALLEGHFILSSGKRSSVYLQSAIVLSIPEHLKKISLALVENIKKIIKIDKINEDIAATNVDRVVALFQNKATRNITKIPGVKRPVKFWIYWNIESKLPKSGFATATAINRETITVFRPILINFDSETWFLENFL